MYVSTNIYATTTANGTIIYNKAASGERYN